MKLIKLCGAVRCCMRCLTPRCADVIGVSQSLLRITSHIMQELELASLVVRAVSAWLGVRFASPLSAGGIAPRRTPHLDSLCLSW
jgi:hypothetical protein